MKALLLTTSVVTLFTLIVVKTTPYFLNKKSISSKTGNSEIVQRSYEIDKIKLEIEMLECDRIFNVRPDHIIQKELNVANAQLTKLSQ
jgi:hypothetical protein